MSDISFNEWQKAVAEAESSRGETPPKGFISMKQFAKLIGKGECRASVLMRHLVENNKAEVRSYMIAKPSGLRKVQYYRLK